MLSSSLLRIKWTLRGKPKNSVFALGGDLILRATSQFTLNQISGQVIEHEELWDLSASSALSQAYFWISRRFFSATESGKDTIDAVKNLPSNFSTEKENTEYYPDPSGDPTKVNKLKYIGYLHIDQKDLRISMLITAVSILLIEIPTSLSWIKTYFPLISSSSGWNILIFPILDRTVSAFPVYSTNNKSCKQRSY